MSRISWVSIVPMLTLVSGCLAPTNTAATSTLTVTRTVAAQETGAAIPSSPGPSATRDPAAALAVDGTYLVGTDVQPGTYKSSPTGDNGYPFCTWHRLSDLSGSLESSIAIENSPGPTFVTI